MRAALLLSVFVSVSALMTVCACATMPPADRYREDQMEYGLAHFGGAGDDAFLNCVQGLWALGYELDVIDFPGGVITTKERVAQPETVAAMFGGGPPIARSVTLLFQYQRGMTIVEVVPKAFVDGEDHSTDPDLRTSQIRERREVIRAIATPRPDNPRCLLKNGKLVETAGMSKRPDDAVVCTTPRQSWFVPTDRGASLGG